MVYYYLCTNSLIHDIRFKMHVVGMLCSVFYIIFCNTYYHYSLIKVVTKILWIIEDLLNSFFILLLNYSILINSG